MRIEVQDRSKAQPIDVEIVEHDCYEEDDYTVEQYTFYRPTQQQIDMGTDHDEIGYMAVCQYVSPNGKVCGKDMPEIEIDYPSLHDSYEED